VTFNKTSLASAFPSVHLSWQAVLEERIVKSSELTLFLGGLLYLVRFILGLQSFLERPYPTPKFSRDLGDASNAKEEDNYPQYN